jgi:hypothetical protein
VSLLVDNVDLFALLLLLRSRYVDVWKIWNSNNSSIVHCSSTHFTDN